MTHYSGGYLIHKEPLLRVGLHSHTSALDSPLSQATLDAVDSVQATPWAVNRFVLDVAQKAWADGIALPGLEGFVTVAPPRVDDDVWITMDDKARAAHRAKRRAIHTANAEGYGKSVAAVDCLSAAQELRDIPAFWYPHSLDFRHRIYPAVRVGLQPQGSDLAKGLLHFAEGVELGPDGLFWLYVRAANTFGMDKLSLHDRVDWALANANRMLEYADQPFEGLGWTGAEEPWQFLATCHELSSALYGDHDMDVFVSHLPVPLDGSCNGLQHLAAMGRDLAGARATNLCSNQPRQDIYADVAAKVAAAVEADAQAGVEAAQSWQGNVSRSVVKRAVMTTPYGVTDRGIRDQLVLDGHVPADTPIGPAADYLRDKIVEAMNDTAQSARQIMTWLQAVAEKLARANVPMIWTTPSGSKVRQAYTALRQARVVTLAGVLTLREETHTLNVRKQSLASAPNVIHSFDAAHLTLTVNAAAAEGVRAFAMIHDSYGTHAGNTTRLARVLREQFAHIYAGDWLAYLAAEFHDLAPHLDIPDPPALGDYDVREVLDSEFFFS